MQSNLWAGSKNLDRHKTFWDLLKDKALDSDLCNPLLAPTVILYHQLLMKFQKGIICQTFQLYIYSDESTTDT